MCPSFCLEVRSWASIAGEAVYPLPDLPTLPVVVAVPGTGVSTAQAFRDLDRRVAAPHRRPAREELDEVGDLR